MTDPAPVDPPVDPAPEPAPAAPTVDELDQAVIDAGRRLADAEQEDPRDPVKVAQRREELVAARAARGWPYA